MFFSTKNKRFFSIILTFFVILPTFSEWDIFASDSYSTSSDQISFTIGKRVILEQYSQEFMTKEKTPLRVTLRGMRIFSDNLFDRLGGTGPLSYADGNTTVLSSSKKNKKKNSPKATENLKKDLPNNATITQSFFLPKEAGFAYEKYIQTPEKYSHSGMDPPFILSSSAL